MVTKGGFHGKYRFIKCPGTPIQIKSVVYGCAKYFYLVNNINIPVIEVEPCGELVVCGEVHHHCFGLAFIKQHFLICGPLTYFVQIQL